MHDGESDADEQLQYTENTDNRQTITDGYLAQRSKV